MGNDTLTTTPFYLIYDNFLSKITDDLYASAEWTREETEKDCQYLLISAIPNFEFPRFPLFDYSLDTVYLIEGEPLKDEVGNDIVDENGEVVKEILEKKGGFNSNLTREEVNILAELTMIEWLSRQIYSIENTRMKYSGSDFKFTSQANHLDKMMKLLKETRTNNFKKQRLYKRRKIGEDGSISSNFAGLAGGVIKREY